MDLDSIPPGADCEQHIRQEIQICDLVLVMIGDNWLDEAPDGGGRRIDQPDDFVRLEIESALASPRVRVIPVLVEGARMPQPAQLPDGIRSLTRYNALELDDRRWSADVGRLAATIASMTRRIEPGPASDHPKEPVPGTLRPARATNADSRSTSRTRTPLVGWIMIALPVLTFGFADFVPALWAANRRPRHRRFRLRMLTFGVLVGLLTYVSIGVVGSIASNPSLTWLTNVAVASWFGCIVIATVVAVLTRKSKFDLPGNAEELQRRREREQYRNLIRSDITLARSMGVGRPDLSRTYSDGGLLDLNSLSPEALARFCPMPFDEAQAIDVVRQRCGRFSGSTTSPRRPASPSPRWLGCGKPQYSSDAVRHRLMPRAIHSHSHRVVSLCACSRGR
jgi:hypothetical protein